MKKIKYIYMATATMALSFLIPAQAQEATKDKLMTYEEMMFQNQDNKVVQFYLGEKEYKLSNYDAALKHFLKAGNLGLEQAKINIELMIKNNQGINSNIKEVVDYLEIVADKGDLFAQKFVAENYRNGAIEVNYEKSYYWYSQAANQGDMESLYYTANMQIKGVGTVMNIPRGLMNLQKVADSGHVNSMYSIAKVHKIGYKVNKNNLIANKYFELAANKGHTQSMVELADNLERGVSGIKDTNKARELFEKAYTQGNKEAAYRGANLYFVGDSANTQKGMKMLSFSAESNYEPALYRLGEVFAEGRYGIQVDGEKAIHYFRKAGDMGNAIAYRKVADIYNTGLGGVKRDLEMYEKYVKLYHRMKPTVGEVEDSTNNLFGQNIFNY